MTKNRFVRVALGDLIANLQQSQNIASTDGRGQYESIANSVNGERKIFIFKYKCFHRNKIKIKEKDEDDDRLHYVLHADGYPLHDTSLPSLFYVSLIVC